MVKTEETDEVRRFMDVTPGPGQDPVPGEGVACGCGKERRGGVCINGATSRETRMFSLEGVTANSQEKATECKRIQITNKKIKSAEEECSIKKMWLGYKKM